MTKTKETYGEDPWLSGYLTTAYVTGIQGGISQAIKLQAIRLTFCMIIEDKICSYPYTVVL